MRMKKLFNLIVMALSMVLFTSCMSASAITTEKVAYEYEYPEMSMSVIIQHGTPFYYNNVLEYYLYNNIYYYPYCVGHTWYFRPMHKPYAHGHIPTFHHHAYDVRIHERHNHLFAPAPQRHEPAPRRNFQPQNKVQTPPRTVQRPDIKVPARTETRPTVPQIQRNGSIPSSTRTTVRPNGLQIQRPQINNQRPTTPTRSGRGGR